MKNAIYVVIGLAIFLIAYKLLSDKKDTTDDQQNSVTVPKVHTGEEPFRIGDGRLKDTWVQFDGVYKAQMDVVSYYMRFYPEGNVTLIAGNEKGLSYSLKNMLSQDSPPGINNVHNTLVTIKGDSLFFTTKSTKGEIDYRGARVGGNSGELKFLKHSRINGKKAIVDYFFEPDE